MGRTTGGTLELQLAGTYGGTTGGTLERQLAGVHGGGDWRDSGAPAGGYIGKGRLYREGPTGGILELQLACI